jgi:hypothetical protein
MPKKRNSFFKPAKVFILFVLFAVGSIVYWAYSGHFATNEVKKKSDKTITFGSKIRGNGYSLHVAAGKEKSGKPYKNKEALIKARKEGKVKEISNSKGIIVSNLTHSEPYLHTDAALILKEIGAAFYKKSDGNRFIVNSLTRTIEGQKKLTKINPVASPNTSSHSYAVSFDIAYSKFNRNNQYDHNCHKVLEEVLKDFQAKKKIYIIREKQSACYHVTARKRSDWKQ